MWVAENFCQQLKSLPEAVSICLAIIKARFMIKGFFLRHHFAIDTFSLDVTIKCHYHCTQVGKNDCFLPHFTNEFEKLIGGVFYQCTDVSSVLILASIIIFIIFGCKLNESFLAHIYVVNFV